MSSQHGPSMGHPYPAMMGGLTLADSRYSQRMAPGRDARTGRPAHDGPDGAGTRQSAHAGPLLGVVALLLVVNLLNNEIAAGGYLLWTSLGLLGLVLLGRADNLHPPQWGMGRVSRRAALAAAVLAASVCVVLLVATRLPLASDAFADTRVTGLSGAQVAFSALIRVPFGTVLFEEVAFRGILLAMLAKRAGLSWAVALSALAFGAWHVLPSLGLASANAAVHSALGASQPLAMIIGASAGSVAGALLCLLRIRYDHLIVPMAVHLATNGMGYLLAWMLLA